VKMSPRSKAKKGSARSPTAVVKANKKITTTALASDDSEANINTKKTERKVVKVKPKKIQQKPKQNTIVLDFNSASEEEEEKKEPVTNNPIVVENINATKTITRIDDASDGLGWTKVAKSSSKTSPSEPAIKTKKEASKQVADLLDMLSMVSDDEGTTAQITENPGRILLEELRNEALMAWV